MTKNFLKILPITIINAEDVTAEILKNNQGWNKSFSPLQVGKKYFYSEINNLNIKLIKTKGFETYKHRQKRGFKKSLKKLEWCWEAHNVDSHSLCEIALNKEITPNKKIYKTEFLQFYRRKIHISVPLKKNFRRNYGTSISLGMPKGSVFIFKNEWCYLGGNMKGKVTAHRITDNKVISRYVKKENINILFKINRRVNLI